MTRVQEIQRLAREKRREVDALNIDMRAVALLGATTSISFLCTLKTIS